MLGYEDNELPNDFSIWEKSTHPDDVKKSWTMQQELVEKKRDRFELEFKMKHKNGHWVDILSRAKAIFDDSDQAVRIIGTHVDITERKLSEKAIRENRVTLETALESMADGVFISDCFGKLVDFNESWALFCRFPNKDECLNQLTDYPDLFEVFLPSGEPAPLEMWAISRALRGETESNVEYNIHRKDTGETWVGSYSFSPIRDDQGKIVGSVVVSRDITELKQREVTQRQLEKKLKQAQKMESIGTLAGGVAHEFNNILAIIMGNNELVMEELPSHTLARECTEEIRRAGLRARDVVKQLLTFSRQDDVANKVIDFKLVVQESLKHIRPLIPANIIIEQRLSEDSYPIKGNDTNINQLLINLCNNAVDAISGKSGKITIELANEVIEKRQTRHPKNLKPGEYAKLIFSDDGIGMNNETIDRVFEPFFTTKGVGEGTGIGMAVVYGIVERYDGTITVDSKLRIPLISATHSRGSRPPIPRDPGHPFQRISAG